MSRKLQPTRRGFVAGAVAAGAISVAAPFWQTSALAADSAPRKRVLVDGKPVKVIDLHGHMVVPKSGELLAGSSIKGRFPPDQIMGGPERFERMDRRGIDMQVLSINDYWWYAADRDLAARIVRVHDEGVAEWCRGHSDRFVGLSSPALQHPELAAEQLEYAVKTLGLRGASVGTVLGEVPSPEKYDPFWRKAEELNAPVFMHPTNADHIVQEKAFEGRGDLGNIIGNPFETTLFLTKLIFDGTLDRFPRLKICGAHGAGYLPAYLGRTQVACEVRANAKCANKKTPADYLKSQILADSMVFSDEGLRHLVAEMGAGQIVYGSDMPFNWPDTIDLIVNAKFLNAQQKEAILGGNLVRLLKI
jgi:aminocarboxymuconate-semialdehyde decarboxylase